MEKKRTSSKDAIRILCTVLLLFQGIAGSTTLQANHTGCLTDSSHISPNSTESATPSKPQCLQAWAIFLLCLAAIMTVFLLAGIPLMLYCLLHSRHLQQQQCPYYNRPVYGAPAEQTIPL